MSEEIKPEELNLAQLKEIRKQTHGWFHTPMRPGDRSLEEQLIGLSTLLKEVKNKTVLDVGCAEGLISIELAKHGATKVRGVEFVSGHVVVADQLKEDWPCEFIVDDVNDYVPEEKYDIVLLLAILHKLKNPSESCLRLADAALNLCVIRMGVVKKPVIIDARSNNDYHNIGKVMERLGFVLEKQDVGPYKEPTWYYRRVRK